MSSQIEWIKQRLPADARFSKHGITRTIDEAINSALEDYTSETALKQKKLALADLLDELAADIKYEDERLGDWAGRKEVLSKRAENLREEAGGTLTPGSFQSVPATYPGCLNSDPNTDEFES